MAVEHSISIDSYLFSILVQHLTILIAYIALLDKWLPPVAMSYLKFLNGTDIHM